MITTTMSTTLSTTTASSSTVDTPIGPFTALVAADGAVLGSGWTADTDELIPQIAPSLRPAEVRGLRDLGPVTEAVHAYHRGELAAIDGIPVRQRSGPFLEHAWEVLRGVTPGEPITYTRFAELSGRPDAVRAAAAACAANAAALFVPCHRVRRIGGALGGFRWGLDVKRWLIGHESLRPGCG
ncbi:methylated-DNA--[protein]-cysteine S-methyltransferase [Sciscionella marina]|uniref:methylated-DNA--[protein]-cysteine S-methyltransferase n=1 Tax=Sciscionella marina TaxID=508770 RepID=UPI0003A9D638|nr:methylated-DNA--[protein]-cysteine S-methyltransferase [Sciscionella marina]